MRIFCIIFFIFLSIPLFSKEKSEKYLELVNSSLDWKRAYDARAVMLGEPDHWIDEKYDYQLVLIEDLLKNGFKRIGFERGRIYMEQINQFVQTGDEKFLAKAEALLSFVHPSRKNNPLRGGVVVDVPTNQQQQYSLWMKKSWDLFFVKLRELRLVYEFDVVGYDVDLSSEAAYLPLGKIFEKHKHYNLVEQLLRQLNLAPTVSIKEEIVLLKNIFLNLNQEIYSDLLKDDYREALMFSRQLFESRRFVEVAFYHPEHEELLEAYRIREETMFVNVDEYLLQKEKIILLGHNAHLSKTAHQYQRVWDYDQDLVREPTWYSLGNYLKDVYGKNVFGVFMLYDSGHHAMARECLLFPCEVKSYPDTIESLLARHFKKSAFVSIKKLYNLFGFSQDEDVEWRENGIVRVKGHLHSQANMIFFVPIVSVSLAE